MLVRIHVIVETIWWTGLAPRVFNKFPFPGSLISTFLELQNKNAAAQKEHFIHKFEYLKARASIWS